MTKPMTYKQAVKWIALNDDTVTLDEDIIASYISTALVADIYNRKIEDVAYDIHVIRRQLQYSKYTTEAWQEA